MALHPPAGWRVFRVTNNNPHDEYIVVLKDDGSLTYTCLFQKENPVVWEYFINFAVKVSPSFQ